MSSSEYARFATRGDGQYPQQGAHVSCPLDDDGAALDQAAVRRFRRAIEQYPFGNNGQH